MATFRIKGYWVIGKYIHNLSINENCYLATIIVWFSAILSKIPLPTLWIINIYLLIIAMFGMEFLPGPDSKSCVNNIHVVGPPTEPRQPPSPFFVPNDQFWK